MTDDVVLSAQSLPIHILSSNRNVQAVAALEDSYKKRIACFLQDRFDQLLEADYLLREYLSRLIRSGAKAVVFGGWARDRVIEMTRLHPCVSRDIDMVSHGMLGVVDMLGPTATINVFGGVGLPASTIHFDAWDLPNTFLIRRHSLPIDFSVLPRTADYTCNALIFMPNQFFDEPKVVDFGAIAAIDKRVIDFQADEVVLPVNQASRSIILAARLNFRLSETVAEFLRKMCTSQSVNLQILEGLQEYCPHQLLKKAHASLIEALQAN